MHLLFFDMTIIEALLILWIPLFLEFPRIVMKCAVLLYEEFVKTAFKPVSEAKPKVSIIVPAHNEGKIIDISIQSLLSLVYPNKEIIVVDDNSSDDTYLNAKPYAVSGDIILVGKREPFSNKAAALRYGSKFASGDIIVCIDADTIIENESLLRIVQPFDDPKTVGVAGNVRVYNTKSLLEQLQAYEYQQAMEMGRRFQSLIQVLLIIPGAFGAFRRKIMDAVGGIDGDTMTEDFDFVLKLRKTGSKITFAPDAIAWTVVPSRLLDWVKQRIRWSYGQLQSIIKHRDLLLNKNFGLKSMISIVDMLFMDVFLVFIKIFWLLSMPLIFSRIPLWKILLLILSFYLIMEFIPAAVASTVSRRRNEESRYLILIPIIVVFYRPLYSFVRFFAYLKEIFGLKSGW